MSIQLNKIVLEKCKEIYYFNNYYIIFTKNNYFHCILMHKFHNFTPQKGLAVQQSTSSPFKCKQKFESLADTTRAREFPTNFPKNCTRHF